MSDINLTPQLFPRLSSSVEEPGADHSQPARNQSEPDGPRDTESELVFRESFTPRPESSEQAKMHKVSAHRLADEVEQLLSRLNLSSTLSEGRMIPQQAETPAALPPVNPDAEVSPDTILAEQGRQSPAREDLPGAQNLRGAIEQETGGRGSDTNVKPSSDANVKLSADNPAPRPAGQPAKNAEAGTKRTQAAAHILTPPETEAAASRPTPGQNRQGEISQTSNPHPTDGTTQEKLPDTRHTQGQAGQGTDKPGAGMTARPEASLPGSNRVITHDSEAGASGTLQVPRATGQGNQGTMKSGADAVSDQARETSAYSDSQSDAGARLQKSVSDNPSANRQEAGSSLNKAESFSLPGTETKGAVASSTTEQGKGGQTTNAQPGQQSGVQNPHGAVARGATARGSDASVKQSDDNPVVRSSGLSADSTTAGPARTQADKHKLMQTETATTEPRPALALNRARETQRTNDEQITDGTKPEKLPGTQQAQRAIEQPVARSGEETAASQSGRQATFLPGSDQAAGHVTRESLSDLPHTQQATGQRTVRPGAETAFSRADSTETNILNPAASRPAAVLSPAQAAIAYLAGEGETQQLSTALRQLLDDVSLSPGPESLRSFIGRTGDRSLPALEQLSDQRNSFALSQPSSGNKGEMTRFLLGAILLDQHFASLEKVVGQTATQTYDRVWHLLKNQIAELPQRGAGLRFTPGEMWHDMVSGAMLSPNVAAALRQGKGREAEELTALIQILRLIERELPEPRQEQPLPAARTATRGTEPVLHPALNDDLAAEHGLLLPLPVTTRQSAGEQKVRVPDVLRQPETTDQSSVKNRVPERQTDQKKPLPQQATDDSLVLTARTSRQQSDKPAEQIERTSRINREPAQTEGETMPVLPGRAARQHLPVFMEKVNGALLNADGKALFTAAGAPLRAGEPIWLSTEGGLPDLPAVQPLRFTHSASTSNGLDAIYSVVGYDGRPLMPPQYLVIQSEVNNARQQHFYNHPPVSEGWLRAAVERLKDAPMADDNLLGERLEEALLDGGLHLVVMRTSVAQGKADFSATNFACPASVG